MIQMPITEELFFTIVFSYFIVGAFIAGWFFGSEYTEFLTSREKLKIFAGCFLSFFFGVIITLIWLLWSIFDLILNTEPLIKNPAGGEAKDPDEEGPFTSSLVQCNICTHKWIAVRPKGTPKLQCPNCLNITNFENIE